MEITMTTAAIIYIVLIPITAVIFDLLAHKMNWYSYDYDDMFRFLLASAWPLSISLMLVVTVFGIMLLGASKVSEWIIKRWEKV